jgi:hypothetical protein
MMQRTWRWRFGEMVVGVARGEIKEHSRYWKRLYKLCLVL